MHARAALFRRSRINTIVGMKLAETRSKLTDYMAVLVGH
jgi:hypothetical protein